MAGFDETRHCTVLCTDDSLATVAAPEISSCRGTTVALQSLTGHMHLMRQKPR